MHRARYCGSGCESRRPGIAWVAGYLFFFALSSAVPLRAVNLESRLLQVEIDKEQGTIPSLKAFDREGRWVDFLFLPSPLNPVEEIIRNRLGTLHLLIREHGRPWVALDTADKGAQSAIETGSNDSVETGFKFSAFPALSVQSRFYLNGDDQLRWDFTLRNNGSAPIEVGTLGFPLPFNNYYEGFGKEPEEIERLYDTCFYVHKYIGGASGYVHVQRLNGMTPDLWVTPGPGTAFEMYRHLPWSLNGRGQWEGLPELYIFSSALAEAEGIPPWENEAQSLALQPGLARTFGLRFTYTHSRSSRQRNALLEDGKAVIQLRPAAVLPTDLSGELVVQTASKTLNILSDEGATFAQLRSQEEVFHYQVRLTALGRHRVTVETDGGERTFVHLYAIPPLRDQILRRAKFIAEKQIFRSPGHALDGAFLVYDSSHKRLFVDPGELWGGGSYEGAINDAQFLAEKNAIYPDPTQVALLEGYIRDFLFKKIQNPSTFDVALIVGQYSTDFGRVYDYPHVFNFYTAMYKIGHNWGMTRWKSDREYLLMAYRTARRMFEVGWTWYLNTGGLINGSNILNLIAYLRLEKLDAQASDLETSLRARANNIFRYRLPYVAEPDYDTAAYEEVYFLADRYQKIDLVKQTLRLGYSCRHLTPSWFWDGSDKRYWDAVEVEPYRVLGDKGETALHYTTATNSLMGLAEVEREQFSSEIGLVDRAYAGMLGVWALVQPDGSASMCYTPDVSSRHYGFNPFSGDVGISLSAYLRGIKTILMQDDSGRWVIFGGEMQRNQDAVTIRPHDGVRHRILVKPHWYLVTSSARTESVKNPIQIVEPMALRGGSMMRLAASVEKAQIEALTLFGNSQAFRVQLSNPTDWLLEDELKLENLWGTHLSVENAGTPAQKLAIDKAETRIPIKLKPGQSTELRCAIED